MEYKSPERDSNSQNCWKVSLYMTMDLFLFYVDFLFPLTRTLPDITIYDSHSGCLIRSMNCLPFVSMWIRPQLLVGSMLLIFLIFCAGLRFCVLFVCVLCLVCPVLPVSLDCLILIAPSVFSNVYLSWTAGIHTSDVHFAILSHTSISNIQKHSRDFSDSAVYNLIRMRWMSMVLIGIKRAMLPVNLEQQIVHQTKDINMKT